MASLIPLSLITLLLAHISSSQTVSIAQNGGYNALRSCAQSCLTGDLGLDGLQPDLGCPSPLENGCYCNAGLFSQASSDLSTCVMTSCTSHAPDFTSALSVYTEYCNVAVPTTASATATSAGSGSSAGATATGNSNSNSNTNTNTNTNTNSNNNSNGGNTNTNNITIKSGGASGLSSGGIIGLAVGIPAGAIALVVAIVLVDWRRGWQWFGRFDSRPVESEKAVEHGEVTPVIPVVPKNPQSAELDNTSVPYQVRPHHELPGQSSVSRFHELPADGDV